MNQTDQSEKTANLLKEFLDNIRAIDELFKEVEALEINDRTALRAKWRGRERS